MSYIVGVDGGGTKTLALIGDREGNVVGRGVSGASNYNAVGFDAACSALESAISNARKSFPGELAALCLGLAGAGRKEDIDLFQNWAVRKFPKAVIKVASDAEILLTSAAPTGAVLALICGTGSIAYGRTIRGELIRSGGWGYLFGDEGSGYAIGIAALRSVMQAYDGRGQRTRLTKLVLDHYGLQNPQELISMIYGAESQRSMIAGLSQLVEQAADLEDAVATAILDEAAHELTRTITAIASKLGSSFVPLVITGGTILHGKNLWKVFNRACEMQGLTFSVIRRIEEPAQGALQCARLLLA